MKADFLKELKERGLVFQVTDEAALNDKLEKESVKLYIGFAPIASVAVNSFN